MIVDETPGLARTQASATLDAVVPSSAAIRVRASITS
jgi:hypothetical protein